MAKIKGNGSPIESLGNGASLEHGLDEYNYVHLQKYMENVWSKRRVQIYGDNAL